MRHGLVSLLDAQGNNVGIGHVEQAGQGVICRHRWILFNGWRFSPTGLTYRPIKEVIDWDAAEARLQAKWTDACRLVDCTAQTLPFPGTSNAESAHRVARSVTERGDSKATNKERIELRGCWDVKEKMDVTGFVLVPDVQWYDPNKTSTGPDGLSAPAFAQSGVRLGLQNHYVEHWAMLNRAFPFLDAEIFVTKGQTTSPSVHETTFFADIKPTSRGSYTVVTCSTWVEV